MKCLVKSKHLVTTLPVEEIAQQFQEKRYGRELEIFFFFFLAMLRGLQDPSSPTRD